MIDNKFEDLIKLLAIRSRIGKIPWDTSTNDSIFVAYFDGGFAVTIQEHSGQYDEPNYSFQLLDDAGVVVDRYYCSSEGDHEELRIASELYSRARRQALKIDVTIDAIIKGIVSKDPLTKKEEEEIKGPSPTPSEPLGDDDIPF